MEKKIRVLQAVGSLGIGGNELFVMNFFRHINNDRFQVDFVIYDDARMDFYDEVIASGAKVFVCKSEKKNKLLRCMSEAKQTYRLLKKENYDVLHCHNCSFLGIMRGVVPGKLVLGTKVIAHAHSVGTPKNTFVDNLLRKILKLILSHFVDYGFACSDVAGASKYTEKFMKSNQYAIINNAVDATKFVFDVKTRNRVREALGVGGETVIGTVGRLSAEKNHRFLLKVFSEIQKVHSEMKLLIVGGGELDDELKKLACELQIDSNVIFTGMVDNPQDYYSAMDVFVMTSLYEGFPFTVIEAQINGLKCVLADTITRETNVSGDVEFLSLDENVDRWAERILEQAQSRSDAWKTEIAIRQYDVNLEVAKLADKYSQC